MREESTQDLPILPILLSAAQRQEFKGLKRLESELLAWQDRLRNGMSHDAFWIWLRSHSDIHCEIVEAVVAETLRFLQTKLDEFSDIKKNREFTDDERAFALHTMIPLLENLREYVDEPHPKPQTD